jgi:hypothetical protein
VREDTIDLVESISTISIDWWICVMRRDGSDVRCLTDNPFEDATPSWLPALTSGSR